MFWSWVLRKSAISTQATPHLSQPTWRFLARLIFPDFEIPVWWCLMWFNNKPSGNVNMAIVEPLSCVLNTLSQLKICFLSRTGLPLNACRLQPCHSAWNRLHRPVKRIPLSDQSQWLIQSWGLKSSKHTITCACSPTNIKQLCQIHKGEVAAWSQGRATRRHGAPRALAVWPIKLAQNTQTQTNLNSKVLNVTRSSTRSTKEHQVKSPNYFPLHELLLFCLSKQCWCVPCWSIKLQL